MQKYQGSFFPGDSASQASPEEVLGHLLHSERVFRSIPKEKVCEEFNIKTQTIEDIESGNFDSGPGRVFIIGFIRSYSKYLDLDLSELLSLAAEEIHADLPSEEMFLSANFCKKSAPSKKIFLACLAAVCTLWGVKTFSFKEKPLDPIHFAELGAINDQDTSPPQNDNLSTTIAPQRFCIEFSDECNLSIKSKDGEIFQQVQKHKGDTLDFDIQSDQVADFGNASAVQIKYAGNTYLLQHDNSVVQQNIPLNIENLLKICYKTQ